ncbi:FAD/NAD(P)-binding protein [Streptomyces sp. NPDC058256]|uniref:FAD/NAD(P)-binding protein n=1 Tax=Streptomyces sp. NPDC058256 TaxID=3346408 RepID=UPI0036DFC69D
MNERISQPAIAVIGLGASAVVLLDAFTQARLPPAVLHLFDPGAQWWRGRAYQQDLPVLRTNAAPEDMSVRYGDDTHFARWLAERDAFRDAGPASDTDVTGLPSRTVYGQYLEHQARVSCERLRNLGWDVRLHRASVTSVTTALNLRLTTDGAGTFRVDRIILCVGNGPPHDPLGLNSDPRTIPDPYPAEEMLRRVGRRDRVTVVGSGLTAVDTVIALTQRGHTGRISLVSRTGILPAVRQKPLPALSRLPEHPDSRMPWKEWLANSLRRAGASPHSLLAEVDAVTHEAPLKRLRRHLDQLDDPDPTLRVLQASVPSLLPRLWAGMDPGEQGEIFARHLRTVVSLCCPMPPAAARALLALADTGRLTLHTTASVPGFTEADVMVNATGTAPDRIPPEATLLTASLTRAGLARSHPLGGLRADPATSRLLGEHGPDDRLYAVGDLTLGTFLFTFGIPAVVERAHDIVRHLKENP